MKHQEVNEWLQRVVGLPILHIGRASNMMWIGFGKKIKYVNESGGHMVKSEYSLHVQAPWRIVRPKQVRVLLAQSDMYLPCHKLSVQNNFDWASFDWETQGNNLFDEKSKIWGSSLKNVVISNIQINDYHDLVVEFSNGDVLYVYVATSGNQECWRILGRTESDNAHVVADGCCVEILN